MWNWWYAESAWALLTKVEPRWLAIFTFIPFVIWCVVGVLICAIASIVILLLFPVGAVAILLAIVVVFLLGVLAGLILGVLLIFFVLVTVFLGLTC